MTLKRPNEFGNGFWQDYKEAFSSNTRDSLGCLGYLTLLVALAAVVYMAFVHLTVAILAGAAIIASAVILAARRKRNG